MATSGVYLLTIRLPRACAAWTLEDGSPLQSGWHVYAGSAMGGLEARLARHLRTSSFRRWHVDHLLAAGKAVDIQIEPANGRGGECRLAELVRSWPDAETVPGFGSSDCGCASHLSRFPRRPSCSLLAPAALADAPMIYKALRSRYEDHSRWKRDPFRTLVSCVLSLRTQDPVTDAASERLYKVMRTPAEFAVADPDIIAKLIFPVGMYRQKARRLIEIARIILDRHGGRTPCEIEELTELPGVGRKTANLVRSFAFHLPAVCVDTHVHRITNRWGLVRSATPDDTESELRRILPREHWQETNALLIQHGQKLCRPTRPKCGLCFLRKWCRYDELRRRGEVLSGVPGAPPTHPSLSLVGPLEYNADRSPCNRKSDVNWKDTLN